MVDWIQQHLPALVILVPFTGAALAFLAGRRYERPIGVVSAFLSQPLGLFLGIGVATRGPLRYEIGGWGAPLGIDLVVDGLSAAMVAVTTLIGFFVSLYALGYLRGRRRFRYFWPLWLFLWGSLHALFLSGDIFNLYVALELVSISAVALVGMTLRHEALIAAMRYMLAAMLGSLFYLLGVALLYGAFGVLDIDSLREIFRSDITGLTGLAVATVGLLLKTALFPLHFWLPSAHANAPSPVSAVLSALVVMGSFYILVRLWVHIAGSSAPSIAPTILGMLGAFAIVWGSLQAFRQRRLKMLIAYSTVAQIGYLFLLFPLAKAGGQAAADAWAGGIFHAVSHALAKAAMFLSAGIIITRFGHDRIEGLGGLSRRAPMTAMAFGLAGMTMMGLPPSGGFVAKWQMIRASIELGEWWWTVVVIAGGLLAAGYVFRIVGRFFRHEVGESDHDHEDAGHSPWTMEGAALALALCALALGVIGQPLIDLIMVGAPALITGVTP